MIRHVLVAVTVLLACAGVCRASELLEQKWSDEVTGEVFLEDLSQQQAEKVCLARAKARAVEQAAGVKVLSETLVKDAMAVADLVNAQSYAWVKDVKDVKWEQETVQNRNDEPPKIMLRVRLKGLVAVDRNQDEGFALKVDLNRLSFQDGDEMQISVLSGQEGYLTIFNVLDDGRVTVLLPNRYKMDRGAQKGIIRRFPDPETMGVSRKLKLSKPTNASVAHEAILVVATKDDIDLVEKDFNEAVFAQFPKQTGLFKDVLEKLMSIPPARRSMAVAYYEIRDKKH